MRIVIDPGHGGSDRSNVGASGVYNEADGNLEFALKLKKHLQRHFEVKMTRETDKTVSLFQRGKMFKGDIFLSIHSDAFQKSTAGGVTVFDSVDLDNFVLGEKIGKAVATAMGIKYRRTIEKESKRSPGEDFFSVIDSAQDNGFKYVLLIERGFHTNPDEEKLLLDEEVSEKTAKAVADVVIEYFERGEGMVIRKEILDLLNITEWMEAGLTGKGVKTKVLGFHTMVSMFGRGTTVPSKKGILHEERVVSIIEQIAPAGEVIMENYTVENIEKCLEDDTKLISVSNTGFGRYLADDIAFQKTHAAGITNIAAAGNFGAKRMGSIAESKQANMIAVSSLLYDIKRKGNIPTKIPKVELAFYSSQGNMVDVASFSGHVDVVNKTGKILFGTSFSCPLVTGMLMLYFEKFKLLNDRFPTSIEALDFVKGNVVDLFSEGHDIKTGYGMFVLPKLSTVKKEVDDVKGHWAEEEIRDLIERGEMQGYEDGTFRPDNPLTRAEYAVLRIGQIRGE